MLRLRLVRNFILNKIKFRQGVMSEHLAYFFDFYKDSIYFKNML